MPRWTQEEIEKLKKLYPEAPKEKILKELKGRTWSAIVNKASELKIKRKKKAVSLELSKSIKKAWIEKREIFLKVSRKARETNLKKGNFLKRALSVIDTSKWEIYNGKWRPKCSSALAYVLGVMLGDGSITSYKHGKSISYVIHLSTIDKPFAETFISALKDIGLKTVLFYFYPSKKKNWSNVYHVFANSKLFVEWYNSLTLEEIESLINGYEAEFIRGFYESEGSVSLNPGNRKSWVISISNRDRNLLKFVEKILVKMGFDFKFREFKRKDGIDYDLRLFRQEDMYRFFYTIKPCIKTYPGRRKEMHKI